MELRSLILKGFRRFGDRQTLHLDGKLVALVGPNEAGKSSLLQAIAQHASGAPIPEFDHSRFHPGDVDIELRYFLTKTEAEAARLDAPTWFIVTKRKDGTLQPRLEKGPPRDLEKRVDVSKAVEDYRNQPERQELPAELDQPEHQSLDILDQLLKRTDKYSPQDFAELSRIKDALNAAVGGETQSDVAPRALAALLVELVQFEGSHDPDRDAVQLLSRHLPKILQFTAEYRDLQLPYDARLKNVEDPKQRKAPSRPLRELMELVDLNLDELLAADRTRDTATRQGLLDDANYKLKELGRGWWTQSDAYLKFDWDKSHLDIHVVHDEGFDRKHRYNKFSERSDGYRQFIALQIFALLKKIDGAILLIDEVEQHLHYDAQADMIQMLTKQPEIGKVIYATHSAGSLPEDLGSGVRLVRWSDNDRKQSEVVNKFWARRDAAGFAPLLFGMGAATMSFFPTRKALIGEGATEMLLLPRLMKEALESNELGFQVVHGLSNFNPSGIPVVDGIARRIAFLVDNDAGGSRLEKALKEAGVNSDRIFRIGSASSIVTIEDLVDETIWANAVQAVANLANVNAGVAAGAQSGRVSALPNALKDRKINIAYEILDQALASPGIKISAKSQRDSLRDLAVAVRKSFAEE